MSKYQITSNSGIIWNCLEMVFNPEIFDERIRYLGYGFFSFSFENGEEEEFLKFFLDFSPTQSNLLQ